MSLERSIRLLFGPMILLGLAAPGCGSAHPPHAHAGQPARPRTEVSVAEARELTEATTEEVMGTVRARDTATLAPSVMGTVRTLRVSLGSVVERGDVLATLTAGEIDAQASRASAVLAEATLDMQRAQSLRAHNAIAAAEVDRANARYDVARAGSAEAAVMRSYLVIRAPISGVVTSKPADVGDLAVPGQPLLVIENPGAMRLEAFVSETLAHDITVGETMRVRIDATDTTVDATVAELAPSADAASRTVLVKLDLPSSPELRAGMFGRVWVARGQHRAIAVPEAAVVRRGQIEGVFVVASGQARLRIVRIGRTREGRVEVLSGLRSGEAVVVTHAERLVDGQLVEVTR